MLPAPEECQLVATLPTSVTAPIEDEQRPPRYRWFIISQLWLHQILAMGAVSGLGVLLVGMQEDLGFGTIGAGWLGSARTVGPFVVLPLSFVIVRFAPKSTYTMLLLGMGIATIAGGFAPTFAVLVGSQIAFSLGVALSSVPSTVIRSHWVPPSEMARVWGIGNALSAVGQSLTLAIVPFALVVLGGWRPIFLLTGASLLIAGAVWQLTAREHTTRAGRKDGRNTRGFAALRRREFYLLGVATLGAGTAYTTAMLFLPLYLVQERGFSLAAAGSITAALPAAGLLSNLSAGFLSDRLGRRKLFIWPMGIALPVLYLLVLSPLPPAALVVAVSAVGYCAWFPFPILNAIPYELPGVEPADVAVGQALAHAVSGLGIIAGPIVASQIAAATGSYRDGLLALSLLPVLLIVGCIMLPETGTRARQALAAEAAQLAR